MEQEEKTQNTNEEKNSQGGCCDFTSEETQGMFKMMRDFCDGSEKSSGDCRSMMKEMMKKMCGSQGKGRFDCESMMSEMKYCHESK